MAGGDDHRLRHHVSYWLSCREFTVVVRVDDGGIIVEGSPVIRRFIGQPFDNLLAWARRLGALQIERIDRPPADR